MSRLDTTAEPICVLLVDDDPDCRELVADAAQQGHLDNEVVAVVDARDALAFLDRRPPYAGAPRPGLIYLDLEMPGMHGQELLRRIKRRPDLCDIPVVILSSLDDDDQRAEAAAAGAAAYVVKPIDPDKLRDTVLAAANYRLTILAAGRSHAEALQP